VKQASRAVHAGLTPDPLPADDDEFIERRVVPLGEALRMAVEGEITESVSKVTLLQYLARRSSWTSGTSGS